MESKLSFLTKYSLNKKLKNKWFLIGNIIIFIVLIALVNIDSIVKVFGGDFNDTTKINIIDNVGYYDDVKSNIVDLNNLYLKSSVKVKKVNNKEKIKKKLKNTNDILLIMNKDTNNIFNVEVITDSYIDSVKYQIIVSSLNSVKQKYAFKKLGIDDDKYQKISSEVKITRVFLDEKKTEDEENTKNILSIASLVIVLPVFVLIVFLVQMIGAEINEEKSTRGMEIIIGSVSVKTHFLSKILASNIFVLFQSLLLIIYSFIGVIIRKLTTTTNTNNIVSGVTESFDVNEVVSMVKKSGILNKLEYVIPLIIILVILSFLAYSLLAGILASVTTNMENFQQLQAPIMIISVAGYYLIILSTMFPGALFIKIAAVVPLLSISLAPSLLLSGEISVIYIITAIILLFGLNYILVKYGLRIYKDGILNYQETNLWKKMAKSLKNK